MKGCDHDRIYSGQINLSGRFAWICRRCGEAGWAHDYILSQVNLDEYHSQRVAHGWATPRLPPPPRVPTRTTPPPPPPAGPFVSGAIFFATLAVACALSAIPWGELGPILPLWAASLATGLALATATVCYVCWKQGIR